MIDNKVIETILGRRSHRTFEDRPVDTSVVDVLLECAFAAPSALNLQPCHFMVIDDRALLNAIGDGYGKTRMVHEASLAIAVCVDVPNYEERSGLFDGTWMEDGATAMENMLLAARALGLEGVWLQVANRSPREENITAVLDMDPGFRVFAMAVLGYPKEKLAPHKGIDESRVHRNGVLRVEKRS
ncbi:MAG: nitroreductase [Dethiosulfovibrio peptidovorans]|nr:MAG: nitroreductase [Dethiosulfovibrio peptidovorans]